MANHFATNGTISSGSHKAAQGGTEKKKTMSTLLFLPGNPAILSIFWGDFLTRLHRKRGERAKQSTGEN